MKKTAGIIIFFLWVSSFISAGDLNILPKLNKEFLCRGVWRIENPIKDKWGWIVNVIGEYIPEKGKPKEKLYLVQILLYPEGRCEGWIPARYLDFSDPQLTNLPPYAQKIPQEIFNANERQ